MILTLLYFREDKQFIYVMLHCAKRRNRMMKFYTNQTAVALKYVIIILSVDQLSKCLLYCNAY